MNNKNSKNKNTYMCIVLTSLQMRKNDQWTLWQWAMWLKAASRLQYFHIKTCQQFLIKDLTILDDHCDKKSTWQA